MPAFDAREVFVHFARRPSRVTRGLLNRLPIAVVRPDNDHRVMRGATAERAGARIVNTVSSRLSLHHILWILLLACFVFIVTNVMVETEVFVLSGTAVEHRHPVVPGLFFAAGLQQQHLVSCLCEARGEWTTPRARADYDVVGVSITHS